MRARYRIYWAHFTYFVCAAMVVFRCALRDAPRAYLDRHDETMLTADSLVPERYELRKGTKWRGENASDHV